MRIGLILPLLAVAGCAFGTRVPRVDSLRLETDRATYAPADYIRLTVENGTDRVYGYSTCRGQLERRAAESSAWKPVRSKRYDVPGVATEVCSLKVLLSGQASVTPLRTGSISTSARGRTDGAALPTLSPIPVAE